MVETALLATAYLLAGVLFILSLRGLSNQETARQGNVYGIIGMLIAIAAVVIGAKHLDYVSVVGAVLIAVVIGGTMAARVAMTAMPEMVALLHSFVGAAAVLVGVAYFVNEGDAIYGNTILLTEIYIDVFIGSITFTGSVVAFLKLKGSISFLKWKWWISGKPLLLPGRHALNIAMCLACVVMYGMTVAGTGTADGGGLMMLLITAVISGVLGIHLVVAIGGADMPVVVSMLNSYSGWTAAAAGFMLSNDLLIITGALVGSSGAILSYIMCVAMARSIWNVIFGGFGAAPPKGAKKPQADTSGLSVIETDFSEVAGWLTNSKHVVITPGYGMAVARAAGAVYEVTQLLRKKGIKVEFAIHPVAGRLPGHMNVLLAEANVPYDIVLEMDEINDDLPKVDTVLVIGANDIVNPGAETDTDSPIYGMPVIQVWNAGQVVMLKRSRAVGYAGVDNPLFYKENTAMFFGDAKDSMDAVYAELKKAAAA